MRNRGLCVVGAILVSILPGCGGTEAENPTFKATDTSQFDAMREQMQQKFKSKSFQKVDKTPTKAGEPAKSKAEEPAK